MATTYITLTNLQQYDNKLKQYIDNGWYNKETMDELLEEIRESATGIDKNVNDLVYYYTKSETYTRDEIYNLILETSQFKIIVVDELPTVDIDTKAFYLLKSTSEGEDIYIEYVYDEVKGWIRIGSQTIDLSNYYTKSEVDELLPKNVSELTNDAEYITAEELSENIVTGMKGGAETIYRTGNVSLTKGNIGLSLVENKSSAMIRSEITTANVVSALGFMPSSTDTWIANTVNQAGYVEAGSGNPNKVWGTDENGVPAWRETGMGNVTGVKGAAELGYRIGQVSISPADIGLGNVENKTSSTIRSEITSENVSNALGYTPISPTEKGASYGIATLDDSGKLVSSQMPEGIGATTLEGLEDTNIINKQNSQVIVYDSGSTKWVNVAYDTSIATGGTAHKVWKTDANGVPGWRDESGSGSSQVTGVKGAAESEYRVGDVSISKENIGLGNVDNKSSATIISEITANDIQNALGYVPANVTESGSVNTYNSRSDFPASGNAKDIYISNDTGLTYRWNADATGAGTFTLIGNTLFAHYQGRAVVFNNEIHLFSASNSSSYSSYSHYQIWNGTEWREETMPFGITNCPIPVVYKNELHILNANNSDSNIHIKWNGSSWETLSDIIPFQPMHSAVEYNGKIYVSGNQSAVDIWSWDDVSQTWNVVNATDPNHHAYRDADLIIHNNSIYSGRGGRLDLNNNIWIDEFDNPYTTNSTCGIVSYAGLIHLFGGSSTPTQSLYWDGITGSRLQYGTNLPINRVYPATVVYNGVVHMIGGGTTTTGGFSTTHYIYTEGDYELLKTTTETPSIDEITDIDIDSPEDGQALLYDSTSQTWKNGTVSGGGGGGSSTLKDLTDTNISSESNGQVLLYDSTSSKWVNSSQLAILEGTVSALSSTVTSLSDTIGEVNSAFNSLFGE